MLSVRRPAYTSALARMASPNSFAGLQPRADHQPGVTVDVMRQADWNRKTIAHLRPS